MGELNKLVQDVAGLPMVRRAANVFGDAGVRPIVAVVGAAEVATALAGSEAEVVSNPRRAEGMGTSIAVGIAALADRVDGAFVALGDMPWIPRNGVDALITTFGLGASCGSAIVVPVHRGRRGHPVLWPRDLFPELQSLTGDRGARGLLERHADRVVDVLVDHEGIHVDIDTPDDLVLRRRAPPGE